jgi:tripartite-type tricarboxylate transporter receptor subunit TctC
METRYNTNSMQRSRRIPVLAAIVVAFSAFLIPAILAQNPAYPKGSLRLVITHGPGGATDLAARLIQPFLQKYLGVPIVLDNMEGAGGNVARSYVFKQPPDGQVLLVSQQPSMSGGQLVSGGRFETLKFVHVFNIAGRNYDCVAVAVNSPFQTIADIKKASAAKPVASAGSGIGTNAYVLAMLLKSKAGINLTYVPYNSGSEAAVAVAGAQTSMGIGAVDAYLPLHKQNKLRILAVSGPQRDSSLPDVPTLVELGHPEIKLDQMTGVFAPPGLPQARLEVLVAAFQKVFTDKEFQTIAANRGLTLQPLPPTEFYKASQVMFTTIKALEPILKPSR